MATVEHCSFLNPALKAKLQDNGFLYLSDLRDVLVAPSDVSKDQEVPQDQPTPLPQRVVLSNGNVDDQNHPDNTSSDALRARLQVALPFLTTSEQAQLLLAAAAFQRGETTTGCATHALTPTSSAIRVQSLGEVLGLQASDATATVTVPPRARITTFCRALDELLGGGVLTDTVTEMCGPPGVGKTQLMQQLAVSCVLPLAFGGLDGSCLYVDTEGSFSVERLRQMLVCAVGLVHGASRRASTAAPPQATTATSSSEPSRKRPRDSEESGTNPFEPGDAAPLAALAATFTVDDALERVHYVRCTELTDLVALLHTVETFKHTRVPDLRMLIIDSIAFPFRSFQESGPRGSPSSGFAQRYRPLLFTCSQLLQRLAGSLGLTVVVSNHVTTRTLYLSDSLSPRTDRARADAELGISSPSTPWSPVGTAGSELSSSGATSSLPQRTTVLIPALGDAWSCGIPTRLLLSFHHYGPSCLAASGAACGRDDTVVIASGAHLDADGELRQYETTLQHRVARLLCSPTEKRGECCFAITRKGIRDMPRAPSV